MYCPGCGAEIVEGSKFCKRCGGNVGTVQLQAPQVTYLTKPTGAAVALSLAATAIALGGLGMVLGVVFTSLPTNPSDGAIAIGIVALIFGSLTVFGIVAMLLRVLARLMGVAVSPGKIYRVIENAKSKPPVYSPVQIPAPPIPLGGSVTEHTTRNFDPQLYPGARERE
jgi:hypothetical protein